MMRRSTLIPLALLCGLTGALFLVKHEVHRLERQVAAVGETIRAQRDSMRILRAEWMLLTSPQRLERLPRPAGLAPLAGSQFSRFAELPESFATLFAAIEEGRAPTRSARAPDAPAGRLR